MYCVLECQIHKKIFKRIAGYSILTGLDKHHPNAPEGYYRMVYTFSPACPIEIEEYKKGQKKYSCEMDNWKFIKEISEKEYYG